MEQEDEVTRQTEEDVLELLRSRGPTKSPEILRELPHIESQKQLSNTLYSLRVKRKIAGATTGEWALADPASGVLPAKVMAQLDAAKKRAAPPKAKKKRKARAARKKRTRVALTYRSPAEQRKYAGSPFAPPEPFDPAIEARLVKAEKDTQQAIDDYVASVCNPKILSPLRASRDSARKALENYRSRGA